MATKKKAKPQLTEVWLVGSNDPDLVEWWHAGWFRSERQAQDYVEYNDCGEHVIGPFVLTPKEGP